MFKYYNNNPFGRHVNDCSVRAIALATNQTWDQTYRILSNYAREEGITFSEVEFINEFLSERFEKFCQSPQNKSIKVGDFANLQLPGRYLITMSGHITCVIDGTIYDTFDPSDRFIWCIYKI